ncbi:MAG TPA: hypothetical protein VIU29_07505 [Candidatus Deferrimicrobiaceae bacterium]
MKKLCLSVLVLFGVLSSGCASGLIGALPEIKDKDSASEVWIFRGYTYVSSGVSAYVAFDDNDVLAIRTVEHAKFPAPPGKHKLGVRNAGFPNNNLDVDLAPRQKYYYAVQVGFTNFSLLPLTEAEAQPYISSTHFVPLEKR